ncbi:hypothetical protein MITS9509_00046 [Synechococcus sp. MIT S9509]|nr:hypothetical protein MITS9504_01419 [Synechococcus sp. MIT S9504]KZR93460.1 hypothetical protein MITS9509_00046 [Synechococcus sp. MIT S9509]
MNAEAFFSELLMSGLFHRLQGLSLSCIRNPAFPLAHALILLRAPVGRPNALNWS